MKILGSYCFRGFFCLYTLQEEGVMYWIEALDG